MTIVADPGPRAGVGAAIAALLLPPLGVFLARGLRPVFWVDVVLTLLGWVPGVLFALVAVLAPRALGRLAD
jgi:uncharacterized membrane protein YqaE (UPF0057 family)